MLSKAHMLILSRLYNSVQSHHFSSLCITTRVIGLYRFEIVPYCVSLLAVWSCSYTLASQPFFNHSRPSLPSSPIFFSTGLTFFKTSS